MFAMFKAKRTSRDASAADGAADSHIPLVQVQDQPASMTPEEEREWVKKWVMTARAESVKRVLEAVAEDRPKDLKDAAVKNKMPARRKVSAPDDASDIVPVQVQVTPRTETPDYGRTTTTIGEEPLLQFSCGKYFCREDDETIKITCIRLGSLSGTSSVSFRTKDKTAQAGVNYHHVEGELVWEPGEVEKTFEVRLVDDNHWAGVLEFRIELLVDSATNGRVTGAEARVQRIDDDAFPSNKFRAKLLKEDPDAERPVSVKVQETDIHPLDLFFEFFKVAFGDPVVKKGSIKLVLVGQLHNIFCILKLIANVYMVDHILLPPEDQRDQRTQTASLITLVCLFFVPQAVMHALHYIAFGWRVVGKTRVRVAAGLMNAFLYFDDTSRTEVDAGALVDAMTHDTEMLVKGGYIPFLGLFQLFGRIMMCVAFQLLAPMLSHGKSVNFFALRMLPMLLFPVFMLALMYIRVQPTRTALDARLKRQRSLVTAVHEFVENFRLVADFGRRQWCMDQHQENVQAFGASDKAVAEVSCNNVYLMKWLTTLAVSSYVILGGIDVINGDLQTGVFLTCLRVYVSVGQLWGQIYNTFLQVFNNAPALDRIVDIINMPSDLHRRMHWSRHQHQITSATYQHIAEEDGDMKLAHALQDRIPIRIENVTMDLAAMCTNANDHTSVKVRQTKMGFGKMAIHQGRLVVLVGKRGQGKSTLLRILGGALLPDLSGDTEIRRARHTHKCFLIPSHLRVLHVPSEDMFIKGSLYENLTLGVSNEEDGDIGRVKEICKRLALPPSLIDKIAQTDEAPTVAWGETMSSSEKHMLVIARALIANPEVLCIHKPTLQVNDEMAKTIVGMLREFVEQRGICLPKETKHLRRPRTCIMTTTRQYALEQAHEVFKVSALFPDQASTEERDTHMMRSIQKVDMKAVEKADLC